MHYIEDAIRIARNEIGYFEKITNDKLDSKTENAGDGHYTKYARDLDAINFYNAPQNGVMDVFVPWCFVQAFGVDAAKEMCGIPSDACGDYDSAIKYYGQLHHDPGMHFALHSRFPEEDRKHGTPLDSESLGLGLYS